MESAAIPGLMRAVWLSRKWLGAVPKM